MRKALLGVLAAALAVAMGCQEADSGKSASEAASGKSASEKEFQDLYKQYSTRFHEKMVTSAEGMQPVQITAEAARIWDDIFAGKQAVLDARVKEILADLEPAPALDENNYLEVASSTRKDVEEGAEEAPKGIVLKQFLWNPVGAAQMALNNWLSRLLSPQSFGVRSVLTANAGLFWEAVDRSIDKPKLMLRQGPMVFIVDLSHKDGYYQLDRVRWMRPKSMGPLTLPPTQEGAGQPPAAPQAPTTGTTEIPGAGATPPPAAIEKTAPKPAEKPAG